MTLRVFIIISIMMLFRPAAWAQQDAAPVSSLQVVVTEDFPPFYYREDGAYRGVSFDIVSLLCARLGLHLHMNVAPMKRLLSGLEVGRYHISPNLTETPDRRRVAFFTQVPFVYESHDLIVRADSTIHFDGNLLGLSAYTFGAMSGWTHGPHFDKANYLIKEYRDTVDAQLRSLLAGRFDIAINNRQFFMHHARQVGAGNRVRVLEPSTYQLPVTIAVSRKLSEARALVVALDRELLKLKAEPIYTELLERYGFQVPDFAATPEHIQRGSGPQ